MTDTIDRPTNSLPTEGGKEMTEAELADQARVDHDDDLEPMPSGRR